jgi:putative membrane protein insertion efficiency factor
MGRGGLAGRRAAILLIKAYQKFISPLLGPHCRFYPTCSHYAIQVYERHGFIKGTVLALCRIARCGPWHPGGFDPAPDELKWGKLFRRR